MPLSRSRYFFVSSVDEIVRLATRSARTSPARMRVAECGWASGCAFCSGPRCSRCPRRPVREWACWHRYSKLKAGWVSLGTTTAYCVVMVSITRDKRSGAVAFGCWQVDADELLRALERIHRDRVYADWCLLRLCSHLRCRDDRCDSDDGWDGLEKDTTGPTNRPWGRHVPSVYFAASRRWSTGFGSLCREISARWSTTARGSATPAPTRAGHP